MYRSLGQAEEARAAYLHSLSITERLASRNPSNAAWQRDLSVSHSKVGDVSLSLGQMEEARAAYRHSLAITERLASQDPSNAASQRDLVVCLVRMAEIVQPHEATQYLIRAQSMIESVRQRQLNPVDLSTITSLIEALRDRGL